MLCEAKQVETSRSRNSSSARPLPIQNSSRLHANEGSHWVRRAEQNRTKNGRAVKNTAKVPFRKSGSHKEHIFINAWRRHAEITLAETRCATCYTKDPRVGTYIYMAIKPA